MKKPESSFYIFMSLILLVFFFNFNTWNDVVHTLTGSSNPSLCDCLKKPYNEVKDYQTHCDNLIKKQFGTKSPSTSQMVSYANASCGGM